MSRSLRLLLVTTYFEGQTSWFSAADAQTARLKPGYVGEINHANEISDVRN